MDNVNLVLCVGTGYNIFNVSLNILYTVNVSPRAIGETVVGDINHNLSNGVVRPCTEVSLRKFLDILVREYNKYPSIKVSYKLDGTL